MQSAVGTRPVPCLSMRRFLSVVLFVAPLVAIADTTAHALPNTHPDFNNDGRGDLVVPAQGESLANASGAGLVHVFYGKSTGFSTANSQVWSQDGDIEGIAENGDSFGSATTYGDFDGDGYDDLAVGSGGENAGAGAVNVIYGSAAGLAAARNQLWREGIPDIQGTRVAGDGFGSALAAADFNDDGYGDLAIGAPGDQSLPGVARGGIIMILYGTSTGLTVAGVAVISQDTPTVGGTAEDGDKFGFALATGDIDRDGFPDLAVGAPGEATDVEAGGLVTVFFGSGAGIDAVRTQTISQGSAGLIETTEARDEFGTALAIGRFDGDNYRDLIVGVPGEDVSGVQDVGAIIAIKGAADSLQMSGASLIHMATPGVAGKLQANALFGSVIERGNLNGDAYHDLVVGVWAFDIFPKSNVGAIVTLYGGAQMLAGAIPGAILHQDSSGVVDTAESFDGFGEFVRAIDSNGDGTDGIFVGVPFEDHSQRQDAGAGHMFSGSGLGLIGSSTTLWSQNSSGVADSAEGNDLFGGSGFNG